MSTTFRDQADREWEIPKLDALVIQRVRSSKDSDPDFLRGDPETGKDLTYNRLVGDPVLLCRVIYLLCQQQREERSISEADFYEQVIGEAIDGATGALLERIKSFTTGRMRRAIDAAAKADEVHQQMTAEAMRRMEDPNLAAELVERMSSMALSPVSSLPASSASTREDSTAAI